MKRVVRIHGHDADNEISITVMIRSSNLLRQESDHQIDTLVSKVMEAIPETPYSSVKLSNLRIT